MIYAYINNSDDMLFKMTASNYLVILPGETSTSRAAFFLLMTSSASSGILLFFPRKILQTSPAHFVFRVPPHVLQVDDQHIQSLQSYKLQLTLVEKGPNVRHIGPGSILARY